MIITSIFDIIPLHWLRMQVYVMLLNIIFHALT